MSNEQEIRDRATGRFVPGNAGGPGNPHARRVSEVRAALLRELTDDDVSAIVRRLIDQAKAGDVPAAREVLDRVLGRPAAAVTVDVAPGPEPLTGVLLAAFREDPAFAFQASDMLRRAAMVTSASDAELSRVGVAEDER